MEATTSRRQKRIMKRKQTKLTDLSFDVLRNIMIYVAVSSDGAANLARMSAVCRMFMELAKDTDILKVVNFDNEMSNAKLYTVPGSFWQQNGLFVRCLCAGNVKASGIVHKYSEFFFLSGREHNRVVNCAKRRALASIRAVERVNTRARQKAYESAIKEFKEVFNDARVDLRTFSKFTDMLRTVGVGKTIFLHPRQVSRSS